MTTQVDNDPESLDSTLEIDADQSLSSRLLTPLRWVRTYPTLWAGVFLLLAMALFGVIGSQFQDSELARAGTVEFDLPPWQTVEYRVKGEDRSTFSVLGTDSLGRDVWALTVLGTPLTMYVGFLAALIGMIIGTVLGFIGGFTGGIIDNFFKSLADILITVPVLMILVVVAVTLKASVDVTQQAIIIAAFVWMWPLRAIRSQVLTMRERAYISVAQISGANVFELIFLEMLPNLLPFLAASFATAVAVAMLTTIGMDALGLGPQNQPTLGNTIYWAIKYSAPLNGLWWWWTPPVLALGLVFGSLYLITAGLDPIANPRLRRQV